MSTPYRPENPSFDHSSLTQQVGFRFDVFVQRAIGINPKFSDLSSLDKIRHLEKEIRMADAVIQKVLLLAKEHYGQISILFELDTLVTEINDREGATRTLTRPFLPAMLAELERLYGDTVNVGVLTSRTQAEIDEEAVNPRLLKEVFDNVAPEFMISAARDSKYNDDIEHVYAEEKIGISQTVNWGAEAYRPEYDADSNRRAHLLYALTRLYPEKAFVIVDNRQWVNDLNPINRRVASVYAGEEMGL